jgi:hypothetical protein
VLFLSRRGYVGFETLEAAGEGWVDTLPFTLFFSKYRGELLESDKRVGNSRGDDGNDGHFHATALGFRLISAHSNFCIWTRRCQCERCSSSTTSSSRKLLAALELEKLRNALIVSASYHFLKA